MSTAHRPWQARLPFFYGWVIVGVAFCMGFFGLGLGFAAALLAPSMNADVGWSRSAVLGAVAVRGLVGVLVSPFIGRYVDMKHGALVLGIIGGIVSSLGLACISFASTEWEFLLLFGVLGGVASVIQGFVVAVAVVPKWFIRLRGITGALTTMGGASSAIGMPILVPILEAGYGWRGTWVALAVLACIVTTIPALLLRRQPEDVGLLPDGDTTVQTTEHPTAPGQEHNVPAHEVLRSASFWLLILGTSAGMLSQTALPANMPLLLADRGFPQEAAILGLTGFGVASVGTKLIWGTLATRYPIRRVTIGASLYAALCTPILFLISPSVSWHGVGYALLMGSSVGGFVAVSGMIWADYYGRAQLGRISGIARPFGIVASWGGVWLMALSADLLGSYDLSMVITTVTWLICAAALFAIRPPAPRAAPSVSTPTEAPVSR